MQALSNVVWRSPVPSSSFIAGTSVEHRPGREVVVTFEFEDGSGKIRRGALCFHNVVHYRTTYLFALRADVISTAYDRVIDMGDSGELGEVTAALRANQQQVDLRHFRLCFDDGPAYDFIASSFEAKLV